MPTVTKNVSSLSSGLKSHMGQMITIDIMMFFENFKSQRNLFSLRAK
jgi:hypothetical protein